MVCNESPETGERTCTKPGKDTCEENCEEGKFCKKNVCSSGKVKFICLLFYHFISHQSIVVLILTVQSFRTTVSASRTKLEKRLASLLLSAHARKMTFAQMRTHVSRQVITFYLISVKRKLTFAATCQSNSDCDSSPSKPVCKETIPGGTKVCQGISSQECLPLQYTDAKGRCIEMEIVKGILLES